MDLDGMIAATIGNISIIAMSDINKLFSSEGRIAANFEPLCAIAGIFSLYVVCFCRIISDIIKLSVITRVSLFRKRKLMSGKPNPTRWRIFVAGLIIWITGAGLAAGSIENLSSGKVGDDLCDICGRAAIIIIESRIYGDRQGTGTVNTESKLNHELCASHGLIHAIGRPVTTVGSLFHDLSVKGWRGAVISGSPALFFLMLILWMIVFLLMIEIVMPSWRAVRALLV